MANPSSYRHAGLIVLSVAVVVGVTVFLQHRPGPHHPLRRTAHKLYTNASIAIGMASVATTTRNVSYCGGSNPDQQLDLYTPKASLPPYPLVVFIHGGGWASGGKSDPIVAVYGPQLVHQGIALASLNYRLAPRYTYPDQDQDVSCALTYLYSNAGRYRLDGRRFGLFGASAGGQLAAYAVLASASRQEPWYPSIRGLVDFYGVTDLTDLTPHMHLRRVVRGFVGPNASPAELSAASPLTYANQPAPPVLIFHGSLDRRVPLSQSQELARDLNRAGNSATLVTVQHAGHGFGLGDDPSVSQIRQQITNFFSHVFAQSS